MKNFYVSAITVVLAVFSSIQFSYETTDSDNSSARFQATKSGGQVHDFFYKAIENQVPIEDALNEALTWDVKAQYEHFQLLQKHVDNKDEYAEYCQKVIDGAQKLLKVTLERIHFKTDHEIDVRDYFKALYDFEEGREISDEMEDIIDRINKYRNAAIEKLKVKQARARAAAQAKAQQTEAEADDQQAAQAAVEEANVKTQDVIEADEDQPFDDDDDEEDGNDGEPERKEPISLASQSV